MITRSPFLLSIVKSVQSCSRIQDVSKKSYSVLSGTNCGYRSSGSELLVMQMNQLRVDEKRGQTRNVSYYSYAKVRRPIQGAPRPIKYNKIRPEAYKYNWYPHFPLDGRYTTKPLRIRKLAGRDPVTGHVAVRTLGGGNRKMYRWIDYTRTAPEGETIEEKVYHIRYDPLHTFLLALVARAGNRRWIIASENVKPGDIIRTSNIIPKNPIRVQEGDAWPVGAMPLGTKVHNIESQVGMIHNLDSFEYKWNHFGPDARRWCIAAGSSAEIGRRIGKMIVIRLPSQAEVCIDERCMATVGRVSNTDHHLVNRLVAQRSRWMGKRPVSGLWHRKDGYCGRKAHLPKPLKTIYSDGRVQPGENISTLPLHVLND